MTDKILSFFRSNYKLVSAEMANLAVNKIIFLFSAIFLLVVPITYELESYLYHCYANKFVEQLGFGKAYPNYDPCELVKPNYYYDESIKIPPEYPPFSLLVFLPPLIWESAYVPLFALEMLAILFLLGLIMLKQKGWNSLFLLLLLLVLGSWFTVLTRFDLVPSFLTLIALLAALRKKFLTSYLLLSLAVLVKLYAFVLIPILFIYEQKALPKKSAIYTRFANISLTLIFLIIVFMSTNLLNSSRFLGSINNFVRRPLEIESVTSSAYFALSKIKGESVCIRSQFGSLNYYRSGEMGCGDSNYYHLPLIFFGLFIVIQVIVFTGLIRKKLLLEQAFLVQLLAVIITNKIFSPQYLIWVTPFVVFVLASKKYWLYFWGLICLLTTVIYPILFVPTFGGKILDRDAFAYVVLLRNLLVVGFTFTYLFISIRKSPASLET